MADAAAGYSPAADRRRRWVRLSQLPASAPKGTEAHSAVSDKTGTDPERTKAYGSANTAVWTTISGFESRHRVPLSTRTHRVALARSLLVRLETPRLERHQFLLPRQTRNQRTPYKCRCAPFCCPSRQRKVWGSPRLVVSWDSSTEGSPGVGS